MGKPKRPATDTDRGRRLRAAAEKKLARTPGTPQDPAGKKAGKIVHELQVHQIELEMQNEELKRARGALEESRDKYEDLYDFAPVGYFTLTSKGEVAEVNLAGAALLGVERPRLVGRGLGRFVAPEDLRHWDQRLASVLQSAEKQTCELAIKREDGSSFYARLDSLRLGRPAEEAAAAGVPGPAIRMAMSDVTERKQIEDAQLFLLQCGYRNAEEDFFRSLALYLAQSLAMDFVCIDRLEGDGLAAQTVAMYSDGAFQDDVAYALKDTPCGDVVGKEICCFPSRVRRLFPRDEVLQKMRAESYVGTTLWSFEGKPIGLIAVIARKPLANPRLAELVLKLVAVRAAAELERREADEALHRIAEEAERSNKDLEQFAYVASHDLQEPLRQITGFLNLLQEQYKGRLDDKADEYIHFATDGAARMARLIRDLLAYARIGQSGRQTGEVSCQETLDRALANLGAALSKSGARVTHDALPSLVADGPQVAQVFQNLVGNSLKFCREGVTPQVHVGARREGRERVLWVKDNGIGIPADQFDRVFAIFQRLHTAGQYPGTGIGLAVCKKIVERHGGRIWVESRVGEGTIFYFSMPSA